VLDRGDHWHNPAGKLKVPATAAPPD
jgi:hypothetical protein